MTDEQWSGLTRHLRLPDTARMPIARELDWYRRLADLAAFAGAGPDPRPSEIRQKLERGASLAGELLDILESLGTLGYHALIDPAVSEACLAIADQREALLGDSSTLLLSDGLERPEEEEPNIVLLLHHAHLTALHDRFSVAAEKFGVKGKPGHDPTDVRALLKRVSDIIQSHTGKPLSKGKRETHFAHKFCELADPEIGPGTIKLALENL
jgi:hypothetical protein